VSLRSSSTLMRLTDRTIRSGADHGARFNRFFRF
jgi:hypothetical protein